jgi:hypothetical protein
MSADNGIYILQSPTEEGHDEFRVTHAQAIDNISFEPNKEGFNTEQLVEYFGKCKVITSKAEAQAVADGLLQQILNDEFCPIVEYGICGIKLPFPFPVNFSRLKP